MKNVSKSYFGLLMSLAEIVIGILLLIDPAGFTAGIIIALGIAMTIVGIGQIIGYFRDEPSRAVRDRKLTKGILFAVFGLFCALRSDWLIATFSVVTILYGVLIFVIGVSKLQQAVDMVRVKRKYWFVALISALLTILFAVLILVNPFASISILWTFIGATLLVEAVLDIVTFICAARS